MEDKCNNPPFMGILKKGGIKDCMINHPKGRIIDTILHILGYLHTFTFLSVNHYGQHIIGQFMVGLEMSSMTKPPGSSFMVTKRSPLLTPASSQILPTRSSCHEGIVAEPGVVTVMSPALAKEVDA